MSKKRRMETDLDGNMKPISPVVHREYCPVAGCHERVSKTRARSDGWFEFKVENRYGTSRFWMCPKHLPDMANIAREIATAIAMGFEISKNPINIGKGTLDALAMIGVTPNQQEEE